MNEVAWMIGVRLMTTEFTTPRRAVLHRYQCHQRKHQTPLTVTSFATHILAERRQSKLDEPSRIPHALLTDTHVIRSHLLGGIIDISGIWQAKIQKYEISHVSRLLLMQIKFLAKSLGFHVSNITQHNHIRYCSSTSPLNLSDKTYRGYRIYIGGDNIYQLYSFLTRPNEQVFSTTKQFHNHRTCHHHHVASNSWSFSIRPLGVGDYYGFLVSGNNRFLLADFTVTHNTAAFLVPLIATLLNQGYGQAESLSIRRSGGHYNNNTIKHTPLALVLAPTRELATQIYDEALKFTYCSSLHPVVLYGGQDVRYQLRELDKGCEIIVATPGRLQDLIDRGRISLALIQYLVFDEADRMLDMGFEPAIRAIVSGADMPVQRQTLMFSATFPKTIQRLASDFLYNYLFIAVGRVGSSSDLIMQQIEYVNDEDKHTALLSTLTKCSGLTLIFVERKKSADALELWLQNHGVSANSIHGDRTQHEREQALAMFRSGACPILVATDVAARGLDIPNVMDVVNFDMPTCIEDYVHRIGRTGRCGNSGTATSYINAKSVGLLKELTEMLVENKQSVPQWAVDMLEGQRMSRGGGGRGRGNFGGRDYRHKSQYNSGGRGGSMYATRGGARTNAMGMLMSATPQPHHINGFTPITNGENIAPRTIGNGVPFIQQHKQ